MKAPRDFILLMHGDTTSPTDEDRWQAYFAFLAERNAFAGGSAIGDGAAFRKVGEPGSVSHRLTGYIRVRAESLEEARDLLAGNPVYEAGGTVEIRELPRDDAA